MQPPLSCPTAPTSSLTQDGSIPQPSIPGPGFGIKRLPSRVSCAGSWPFHTKSHDGHERGGHLQQRSDITRDPGFPTPPSFPAWGLRWVGEPQILIRNHASSESGLREKLLTEMGCNEGSSHPHPLITGWSFAMGKSRSGVTDDLHRPELLLDPELGKSPGLGVKGHGRTSPLPPPFLSAGRFKGYWELGEESRGHRT